MSQLSEQDFKHEIAKVFHLTDGDGNGRVDRDEVKELMKTFNFGKDPSDYEMVKVMEDLDTNKDGVISYKEFERGMLKWLQDKFQEAPSSPGVGAKRQASSSTSSTRKKIHVSLSNYFTQHTARDDPDSIAANIKSQILTDEWTEFVDPITAQRASEEDARELEGLWKEVKEFCEHTDELVENCNSSNLQTASVTHIRNLTHAIEKMLSIVDYVHMPTLKEDMRELLNEVFYHLRRHQVFGILSQLVSPSLYVVGDPGPEKGNGALQFGENHVAILCNVLKSLYFYLVGPTSRSEDREELKHRYFVAMAKTNNESIASMTLTLFRNCDNPEIRQLAIQLLGALASKDSKYRVKLCVDFRLSNLCTQRMASFATGNELVAMVKTLSILCGETHGAPGETLNKENFENLLGGTTFSRFLCDMLVAPRVASEPNLAEHYPLIVSSSLTALSHLLPFIQFRNEALWNMLLQLSQNQTLWDGMTALQLGQTPTELSRKTREHAVNCRYALRAILGVCEVAVQLHDDYEKKDIESLTNVLVEPLAVQMNDQSIATSALKLLHMFLEENLVNHDKRLQELLVRVYSQQLKPNSAFAVIQILNDVVVKGSQSQFLALLQGGLIDRLLDSFKFFNNLYRQRDAVLANLYSYSDPLLNVELASVTLDTLKKSLQRAQEIGEDRGSEKEVLQCLNLDAIGVFNDTFDAIYAQKFQMVSLLSSAEDVDSYLRTLDKSEVYANNGDAFASLENVEKKLCSVIEIIHDLHSRFQNESTTSAQTAEKLANLKRLRKDTDVALREQLQNRRQGLAEDADLTGKLGEGKGKSSLLRIVVSQEGNPKNYRTLLVSAHVTLKQLKNHASYEFGGPVELKYEDSDRQQKPMNSDGDWKRAISLSSKEVPPKLSLIAYDDKHGGQVFDVSKYSCPQEAIDEIKACCSASVSFDGDVTQTLFYRFKEMRTSSLTYEQFATVLKEEKINQDDDDNRLRLLFNAFDKSNDGKIDFQEIVVGLATMYNGEPIDRLRLAFDSVDDDGDGFLSFEEVKKLATKSILLSKTLEQRFDPHQVAKDVMDSCDHNNDQQLSFSEFQEAVFFNFQILAAPFMNFSNGGSYGGHKNATDRGWGKGGGRRRGNNGGRGQDRGGRGQYRGRGRGQYRGRGRGDDRGRGRGDDRGRGRGDDRGRGNGQGYHDHKRHRRR